MAMAISNDLNLARLAVRHMVALHCPQDALLKEHVVALGVAWRLKARFSDVEVACTWVPVRFVVCLRSMLS